MPLVVGDHLVIKRDGKLITEEDKAYHEFEVVEQPEVFSAPNSKFPLKSGFIIKTEVVT